MDLIPVLPSTLEQILTLRFYKGSVKLPYTIEPIKKNKKIAIVANKYMFERMRGQLTCTLFLLVDESKLNIIMKVSGEPFFGGLGGWAISD